MAILKYIKLRHNKCILLRKDVVMKCSTNKKAGYVPAF